MHKKRQDWERTELGKDRTRLETDQRKDRMRRVKDLHMRNSA